jgi:hypothetical protein
LQTGILSFDRNGFSSLEYMYVTNVCINDMIL